MMGVAPPAHRATLAMGAFATCVRQTQASVIILPPLRLPIPRSPQVRGLSPWDFPALRSLAQVCLGANPLWGHTLTPNPTAMNCNLTNVLGPLLACLSAQLGS